MGQGSSAAGEGADGAGSLSKASAAPEDYYELLGISSEATFEEIRKGFRKEALRWHPDKNAGSEEASKRFVKIQAAYDVLSDDQERAYYDNHRGDLTGEDATEDFDFRARAAQASTSKQAVRINSKHLMRFFDSSLWSGTFDDSENGFYGIYRLLFDTISQSEYYATAPHGEAALASPPFHYPSFGHGETKYDSPDGQLKSFYKGYLNFASRRAFSEVDKYRLSDAPDRRVKRLMEKENKRARDDARKDYNEAVRSLAQFVKKRDPRFLNSQSKDPLRTAQLEKEKLKRTLREAAFTAAKQREENAKKYVEQDWQRVRVEESEEDYTDDEEETGEDAGGEDNLTTSDDAEEDGEEEEGEEAVPDWYCPACEKEFSSQGAWDNHERSKKHIKNMERLKREMQAEDDELGLSAKVDDVQLDQQQKPDDLEDIKLSKKDKKKIKKRFGVDLGNGEPDATSQYSDSGAYTNEATATGNDDLHRNGNDDKSLSPAASGTATPIDSNGLDDGLQTPQLSKKDKRRAREAAKKEQQMQSGSTTPVERCNICQEVFSSRTKLFAHVKEEGHATAQTASEGPSQRTGGKKGKRK